MSNADLADQLGNLLSRVLGMVTRYYAGIVPVPSVLKVGWIYSLEGDEGSLVLLRHFN